jgi:hypothetical protein
VAAGPSGVRHVAPAASPEEIARAHRERFGRLVSPADEELVAALAERVEKALAGEREELPLDLSGDDAVPAARDGGGERHTAGRGPALRVGRARPGRGGLRGPSGT